MKLRKVLAATLAIVMVVAAPVVAKADLVTEDTTFTDKVADGSAGWASNGTGVTFPINEDGVTVVFHNDGMIRDNKNWSNFVIETIATDAAAGVTLRGDAFGWTYGDNTTNVPTFVSTISWEWANDTGENECAYLKSITDDATVTVNAKKTDANTVVFDIKFAADAEASEVYTVTYPNGVPEDLSFQIGADGGKVTLTSVDFPEEEQPDEIEKKGDMSMAFTAMVVVAGVALVAFASKKRFA